MQLLGQPGSINVRKVLWTCHELGLVPEHIEWGSAALPLSSPEFLRLNPNGLVPVLVEGNFVLRESNTICRYLAARAGRLDLLPAEPAVVDILRCADVIRHAGAVAAHAGGHRVAPKADSARHATGSTELRAARPCFRCASMKVISEHR